MISFKFLDYSKSLKESPENALRPTASAKLQFQNFRTVLLPFFHLLSSNHSAPHFTPFNQQTFLSHPIISFFIFLTILGLRNRARKSFDVTKFRTFEFCYVLGVQVTFRPDALRVGPKRTELDCNHI